MKEIRLQPATLAAARAARGLSLAALADRSGVSVATLSRLESGLREADGEQVTRLAEALEFPANALAEFLPTGAIGLPGFYHRRFTRAAVKQVRRIEGACLMGAIGLHRLTGLVEIDAAYRVPELELDDFGGDVERAAESVRAAWQLPPGPIESLTLAIERAGGLVLHFDFEIEAMDAMYQIAPTLPPVFWVNSRKPVDRVRFSLAHELGHAVLHHRPTEPDLAEDQANQFAAALLMPRADFRRECPSRLTLPDLAQLKRRWRTAMSAIVRRASCVGRITETQYTSLMVQLSRNGWRKYEPVELAPEVPSLVPKLLETCMTDGGYDRSTLAAALRLPEGVVRDWMQPVPRRDESGQPRLRLVV